MTHNIQHSIRNYKAFLRNWTKRKTNHRSTFTEEIANGVSDSDFEIFINNMLKKREFQKRTVIYKSQLEILELKIKLPSDPRFLLLSTY